MMLYFDNNATTRPDDAVIDAMLPFLRERYENPSSVAGIVAGLDRAIAKAQIQVGALIGAASPTEIIFTSGATESNNWVAAIAGTTPGAHIIASSIEHDSMYEPLQHLMEIGHHVELLPVDKNGLVSEAALFAAMRKDTCLVSIIAAHNETGVIQNVAGLSELAKKVNPNALFHTDATQMMGKADFDLTELIDVDLVSVSAHKFYGPKGTGALFIREGVRVAPLLRGGGQQGGLRSGTENIPLIVGMGMAAKLSSDRLAKSGEIAILRDGFEALVREKYPEAAVVSSEAIRLPNTSLILFSGRDGRQVVDALAARGVAVATGSACSNGSDMPSRALVEMGYEYAAALAAVRFSFGYGSTLSDSRVLFEHLVAALDHSSALSGIVL